jgi:TPR repeat protein
MSADESRPSSSRRPRPVEKKALPEGSARDLRDAVYRLYAEADRPQLAELARQIAGDEDLPGSPGKDLIGKIISGELAGQQDTVTVAVTLARLAGHRDVAQIAEQVRQSWTAAATAEPAAPVERLGRPVSECDPLALEVHQAIHVHGTGAVTDPLPGYVPRAHDTLLREAADRLLGGESSRLVTLVGGSSTGKTRACWELAHYLDQKQPGRWWVWHPYDPTRPQAAVADLERVGAHTVVWLNEAQHYLMPTDSGLGEQLAAGLRTLLHDPGRAPVLVLATLWPQYFDTLTVRPDAGQSDPYAQARELLAGTAVTVADTFTPDQVAALSSAGVDARLRYAAEHAGDGRIIQFLAGAPELETRYRTVGPAARALIQVAMDARRLGHPLAIHHALLKEAAPGYLDDHDWDRLGEDWIEQALAETARDCKGARGPLTRIRSRPGRHTHGGGPYYRLADYLEQTGRIERAGVYPPDNLWRAFATTLTDPSLLRHLGEQAEWRGRYQHAIWLYTAAADHGDTEALRDLVVMRERAGDTAGAMSLAVQTADRGNTEALWRLALMREEAGETAAAIALYQQAADRGSTRALWHLAEMLQDAGDIVGAEALYWQAADRGSTEALRRLVWMRHHAGDTAGAVGLAVKVVDRCGTEMLRQLAWERQEAGDTAVAEALYRLAADRGNTQALWNLAEIREQAGDSAEAAALAVEAADRGDTTALRNLAWMRQQAGDTAKAEALCRQAADRGDTTALRDLVWIRQRAGDSAGAATVAVEAAGRGDTTALRNLAWMRQQAGDTAKAEALFRMAADRGDTTALRDLARLQEPAGDTTGTEALSRQVADRVDTTAERPTQPGDTAGFRALYQQAVDGNMLALGLLATMRANSGSTADAEALYRQVADHGHPEALRDLARMQEQAGDTADAETLYRQAADRGDTTSLRDLARLRERVGDIASAEALYQQAADHGILGGLKELVELRAQVGDSAGADRIRRFGLTGSGEIAGGLDFNGLGPTPST